MKKLPLIFAALAAIFFVIGAFTVPARVQPKPALGTNIGNEAPDLNFNDPQGKPLKLSSLRGHYVLLDFWASWCMPCRMENPNLVKAYEKYNKANFKNAKGFEIYNVSLDRSKEAWVAAIEKDGLKWKYHVSDLGFWDSKPAQIYGIQSIPTNFLLDPNGVIIAKNLRGAALETELAKYINTK